MAYHHQPGSRYAILYHDGIDDPHFDLLFESSAGGDLWTWRSPAWPFLTETLLRQLPNHRRQYLEFEGPLTHARGFVTRIEAGTFSFDPRGDHQWIFHLNRSPALRLLVRRTGDSEWVGVLEALT